jgi:hypothetical protein
LNCLVSILSKKSETKRNKAKQSETKRNKAKQSETKRNKAKQSETKRNKAKQSEQSETKRMSSRPSAAELQVFMGEIRYYEDAIYNIIEDMVRFKPKNKSDLINAIKSWDCEHTHDNAFNRYGPIEIWNIVLITHMSYLLKRRLHMGSILLS